MLPGWMKRVHVYDMSFEMNQHFIEIRINNSDKNSLKLFPAGVSKKFYAENDKKGRV